MIKKQRNVHNSRGVIMLWVILHLMISADTFWRVIHHMKANRISCKRVYGFTGERMHTFQPHVLQCGLVWYDIEIKPFTLRAHIKAFWWCDTLRGEGYTDTAKVSGLLEMQSQICRGRGGSSWGANEGGCEKCEREGRWVCVKEQIYGASHRWGRMVGVSRLQRRLPPSHLLMRVS